ncbi:MAG: hypothetical protein IKO42_03550, partial [Opitutales bacterium]|nr:hypothetical protein [Opitutales bacterium]
ENQKRKVIVKNTQKRNKSVVKRINIVQPQQINTPQVEISLPTGTGGEGTDGIGLSDFSGMTNLANLKIDLPEMDIFGAKAKSDRVFIVLEASPFMMNEDMGAFESYNIVKDEIKKLVKMLPSACVFNVMATDHWFSEARNMCFPTLVPATNANKDTFDRWISAINSTYGQFGNKSFVGGTQYQLKFPHPPSPLENQKTKIKVNGEEQNFRFNWDYAFQTGVVDRYKVYQAAIEQGAGAIWILTSSWPGPEKYYMPLTDDQVRRNTEEWERNLKKAEREGKHVRTKEDWDNWQKAIKPYCDKAKEWLDKENARRRSKGIPQRVVLDYRVLALELKMKVPDCEGIPADHFRPNPKFKTYNTQSLLACYEPIFKKVYDERKLPRPTVNIILLLTRKEEWNNKKNSVPKAWAFRNGKGTVRILRGGKPISEYEKEEKEMASKIAKAEKK